MVKYIDPADAEGLRSRRQKIEQYIKQWCDNNKIGYFGTYERVDHTTCQKIVKTRIFELIGSLSELRKLDNVLEKNGQQLFYLTDNLIDASQSAKFKNITLVSINELFGMIDIAPIIPNTSPSRLFNCFIQRVESVRQTWFYFLHHHDLLRKGYVSFLLFQYRFYSEKTGVELYDWIHHQYQLNELPHFEQAYHDLKPLVPFCNFSETSDLRYMTSDSKYSVVLETYAVEDGHLGHCFTEKMHRALQSPTINLLFAQQNSLTNLSKLGFRIDDWMLEIDKHSWIERQQKLLNILINDSIVFDPDQLYNNALHNQAIFSRYKEQLIKGHFLDKIFSEVASA